MNKNLMKDTSGTVRTAGGHIMAPYPFRDLGNYLHAHRDRLAAMKVDPSTVETLSQARKILFGRGK